MGWSVGYDSNHKRDVGYGVPSICDHPDCNEEINRGLGYVCGGDVYGGEHGCGLFFCGKHLYVTEFGVQCCDRCSEQKDHFEIKPDTKQWIEWKLNDESWWKWRDENPEEVEKLKSSLIKKDG